VLSFAVAGLPIFTWPWAPRRAIRASTSSSNPVRPHVKELAQCGARYLAGQAEVLVASLAQGESRFSLIRWLGARGVARTSGTCGLRPIRVRDAARRARNRCAAAVHVDPVQCTAAAAWPDSDLAGRLVPDARTRRDDAVHTCVPRAGAGWRHLDCDAI